MSLGAARAASTREYQLLDTGTITSTGSQSYTIPAGTLYLEIEVWGAGGGGGAGGSSGGRGGTAYQGGGGGGGGAYCKHKYQPSDMQASDTLNFTVGAGGAGSVSSGGSNKGADGVATTLDSHIGTRDGSLQSIASFSVSAGGAEGNMSGFAFSFGGTNGDGGTAANGNITNTDGTDGTARPAQSGSSSNGSAGGAGANGGAGGAGGTVHDGGDGTVPGGGGGGGRSDCSGFACPHAGGGYGGDGADGKVIVKAYG